MLNGFKILTVTHRQTSLQHIEKFVVTHSDETVLRARLEALKAEFGLAEMMYLATCNRVMFLFYSETVSPPNFQSNFFQHINPSLSEHFITENVTLYEGRAAAEHLYRVASSIDSLVVGEREILRQLREAYDRCQQWSLTADHLRIAMQGAVVAAKEVYTETRLGDKPVSVVSLAIRELLKTKLPNSTRILMVGAGQTNILVAKFLAKNGFQNVTVFNRTLERAQRIAISLNGRAFGFDELADYKEGFDCLIVCTGATKAVVDNQLYIKILAGETGKKVIIDLSVPNNVCKEVVANHNVHFIEIEGLRALAQENRSFREQEVTVANELLDLHLAEFVAAVRNRRIERALHQVPAEMKAVKEYAMNKVFKKEIDVLDDSARELLERMMDFMEKKCTGIPIKVAKEALAKPTSVFA
ncbi:MAG: glutamyl-tRNA reductase [Saprospiraceae bacterium]|nr:glutamyl-tRNA reductase [Saprospiraceae bacterium]